MNIFERADGMTRPKDADSDPLAAYRDGIVAKFDTQTHAVIENGGTLFVIRKQQPDTGLGNALPARTTSDHVARLNERNRAFWGKR